MWAYKYLHKDSRTNVPKYWTFLKSNHDMLKLWFEDQTEPLNDRVSFPVRCIKFNA